VPHLTAAQSKLLITQVGEIYQDEINGSSRSSTMKRILFYSIAASAVCAMAMSNADAATRKHHPKGHYEATAAKLKKVANRQLVVGESIQMSVGRSIAGDGSFDRAGFNGCFRTLNYLSSASACGGGGGN
jgi:hypothetical protein